MATRIATWLLSLLVVCATSACEERSAPQQEASAPPPSAPVEATTAPAPTKSVPPNLAKARPSSVPALDTPKASGGAATAVPSGPTVERLTRALALAERIPVTTKAGRAAKTIALAEIATACVRSDAPCATSLPPKVLERIQQEAVEVEVREAILPLAIALGRKNPNRGMSSLGVLRTAGSSVEALANLRCGLSLPEGALRDEFMQRAFIIVSRWHPALPPEEGRIHANGTARPEERSARLAVARWFRDRLEALGNFRASVPATVTAALEKIRADDPTRFSDAVSSAPADIESLVHRDTALRERLSALLAEGETTAAWKLALAQEDAELRRRTATWVLAGVFRADPRLGMRLLADATGRDDPALAARCLAVAASVRVEK